VIGCIYFYDSLLEPVLSQKAKVHKNCFVPRYQTFAIGWFSKACFLTDHNDNNINITCLALTIKVVLNPISISMYCSVASSNTYAVVLKLKSKHLAMRMPFMIYNDNHDYNDKYNHNA